MYSLSDNYEVTGLTLETLQEEIKSMEDATSYVLVDPKEIRIASTKGRTHVKGKGVRETFFNLDKKSMDAGYDSTTGRFAPLNQTVGITVGSEDINEQLLNESIAATGTVVIAPIDGHPQALYVAPTGMAALAEKAGVGGLRMNNPSTLRDLYIAEGLYQRNGQLKLAIRTIEEDGREDKKLFGVLTEKYTPLSLQIIPRTIDAFEEDGTMGQANFRYWRNTQTYTEALVEFPESAEDLQNTYGLSEQLIPGIRISTSDTGESAARIQATCRKAGSRFFVIQDEIKKNHMGEITVEKILEDVRNKLYAEMKEIPKRMSEMLGKTIGEPDLTTEKGKEKNKALVEKAIRHGIRKLHIGQAIGQTRCKNLAEQLINEVDASCVYTEYDIAMIFMGLGDRVVGMPDSAKRNLEKACGQAPFISYQKDDEASVALLPEEV